MVDEPAIALFDGVCNLCNGTVNFIIDHDPDRHFRFAPLQSEPGRALLEKHGLPAERLETFVLVEGERAYTRSSAALRVVRRLGWPWRLGYVFIVVPRPLRDLAYNLVAKYRYSLFGRRDTCRVPTAELRSRFLDAT